MDLFGNKELNKENILSGIDKTFGKDLVYTSNKSDWAIYCYIQDIKVDIIHYNYSLIVPLELIEGINLYSNEDIIAMKINAVLGRGMKKDFRDIYELLHHLTL